MKLPLVIYRLSVRFYVWGIRLAAIWNAKARKWTEGRKDIFGRLERELPTGGQLIWFHCASLGEFEQGRPLIEKLRESYPDARVLLSFFSPSGYEVRKNYNLADHVCYLPADSPANAKRFYDLAKPSLVIFVKYEFWYFHLREAAIRKIPLLLVSAHFQRNQQFFRGSGRLHREMLSFFTRIFVQNSDSAKLLETIHFKDPVTVAGDTRFDRVRAMAEQAVSIPGVEEFIAGRKTLVAGSTWPEDEEILASLMLRLNESEYCIIIAPHEVAAHRIAGITEKFPESIRFSQLTAGYPGRANCLVIDNIGMLSSLYRYAWISYVGGGFNRSGVHNVPEAAVYGVPVFIGPQFQRFLEVKELVALGAVFSCKKSEELLNAVDALIANPEKHKRAGVIAKDYVAGKAGATQIIINYIQENRLLTSS